MRREAGHGVRLGKAEMRLRAKLKLTIRSGSATRARYWKGSMISRDIRHGIIRRLPPRPPNSEISALGGRRLSREKCPIILLHDGRKSPFAVNSAGRTSLFFQGPRQRE